MRQLYPPIEPNKIGYLDVGDGHVLYWEESGNSRGIPIVFLHGGPGSGTTAKHRSYFDPTGYRIILFDQRGSGKSTPHASLHCNTTWDLVSDMEKLRTFLAIDRWVVFGGSWGSTLALVYAQTHPSAVRAMILRGIFLGSKQEIDWLYQDGSRYIFADYWEEFIRLIPNEERGDLLRAYYKRLISSNPEERKKAAQAWSAWEGVNLRLIVDPMILAGFTEDCFADAHSRIECHYFINQCFFKTDHWILENMDTICHIPARIIQGRYDMVCPFTSAWELHKAWKEAEFEIIPDAGHSASEVGITDALIRATDYFGGV